MPARLEFFGLARHWAGVKDFDVPTGTLGTVLRHAAEQLPVFAERCLTVDQSLRDGYLANLNGLQFTRDHQTIVTHGDVVLIMNSDVGG